MSKKVTIPSFAELKAQAIRLAKSKHFRKYLMAGFTAFFVDFMVFRTMYVTLDLNLKLSTFCGILAGFITSFLLQKFWSFKGEQAKKAHLQVLIYAVLTIVNTLFTELMVKEAEVLGIKHAAELGKIVATGFIVIWNFTIFKLVVFRPSKEKK